VRKNIRKRNESETEREAANTRNRGRRRKNEASKQRNTYVANKHVRELNTGCWSNVAIAL
jgi:hypothetical protein